MAIDAEVPLLSILIAPVGSNNGRGAFAVTETYAGLFSLRGDGGASPSASEGGAGFESLQFQGQTAFKSIAGPLEYVRFENDGTVARGVQAAVSSRPDKELCGLTARLRTQILQNRMQSEPDATRAPRSPASAEVLLWKDDQGEAWETIIPARAPVVASVRHRSAPLNRTVKIKTARAWAASGGFEARFDLGGIAQAHLGAAAIRLIWGDKFSLLMRGEGADVYPVLERRRDGKWEQVRILNRGAALDAGFWKSTHILKVKRCGGRMMWDFNGQSYWIREVVGSGDDIQPTQISWPRAALRLNVMGADCSLQVHRLTGKAEDGEFLEVKIEREVPTAQSAPPDEAVVLRTHGAGVRTAPLFGGTVKTLLRGDVLDRVSIEARWENSTLDTTVKLRCSEIESPLLCSFAAHFPPSSAQAPPPPIEFAAAISQATIDSGDPETLPSAEASFTFSRAMLEQLVPDWETALLPYRPVVIRAKYASDAEWTTLFRGYLTPENASREAWGDYEIPLVARDPMIRLMEQGETIAGLIDERFGPLDLQMGADRSELYGAECAKHLLEVELGENFVANFNGNGDALRYFNSPIPLLSFGGAGYFEATQTPQSGGWRLPAPYGGNIKSWIDSLAKFDRAVWFYDASEEAFFYGNTINFLFERNAQVWEVPEVSSLGATTTREFPLLSSLSLSGLLEGDANDVRVWGVNGEELKGIAPSLIMGRAGDPPDPDSLDPLSVAQSWRRTFLLKPDFVKAGTADNNYANGLAATIWQGFEGKPVKRLDLQFDTGFPLKARWGELIRLPDGFEGLQNGGIEENWRILQVKRAFDFSGKGADRFKTTITTRALTASGL